LPLINGPLTPLRASNASRLSACTDANASRSSRTRDTRNRRDIFDDSSASHYRVARPLLKRYGFGATFFITEGFSFLTNKLDYMTWEQIGQLHRDGFEIGNHTRDHLGVSDRTLGQVREATGDLADNTFMVRKSVLWNYYHPGSRCSQCRSCRCIASCLRRRSCRNCQLVEGPK